MGRLLVSVRGPKEALAAAEGGAHIADVEYPASALGTPYPLNIKAVREALDGAGFEHVPISTNIGEDQPVRSSACQAALGVAVAGAEYIKCGLAGLEPKSAAYLGRNLVRTVREWFPKKKVYPAVFADEGLAHVFDPLKDGPALAQDIDSDGLLIDTFNKDIGLGRVGRSNEAVAGVRPCRTSHRGHVMPTSYASRGNAQRIANVALILRHGGFVWPMRYSRPFSRRSGDKSYQ